MKFRSLGIVAVATLLTGCPRQKDDGLSSAQAREALEEAALASKAEALTSGAVEISTHFTIGQGVEAAAEELSAFFEAQLPCAEVVVEQARLEITYGARPGSCTYRGQTFSGQSAVTIDRNDAGEVVVEHEWLALSNGAVTLDGDATVTWNLDQGTRRVVHDALWTDVATGKTVQGSGDRTQSLLDGGLAEGIRVDGVRSWTTPRGEWDLGIDGVELRWVDPVPQAGSYTLATPDGKSLSLSFARKDADTISVEVASGKHQFRFDVTALGISQPES